VLSDRAEIRDLIVQFYNSLFTEQFNWRPKSMAFFLKKKKKKKFNFVDGVEVIWLERAFKEEEVLEAVKAMNIDKALWHSSKLVGM
jgi:hypothetical protein